MGTIARDLLGDHDPANQVIDLPDGATLKDLFTYLRIPECREYAAIVEKKVGKPEDPLSDGMAVTFFQTVYGG
mgnify:FL=1